MSATDLADARGSNHAIAAFMSLSVENVPAHASWPSSVLNILDAPAFLCFGSINA